MRRFDRCFERVNWEEGRPDCLVVLHARAAYRTLPNRPLLLPGPAVQVLDQYRHWKDAGDGRIDQRQLLFLSVLPHETMLPA